jgi:alcohol dehydrogenase
MQDYWGQGKATGPLLPMIAVPTTAGTGSETQSYALIADAQTHVKMACGDKRAAFRVAILDPELTLTQPPRVTALTGIDAISHAIETYVSRAANPLSQMFSRQAWQHLFQGFDGVLEASNQRSPRESMQLGACFAGLAIENSMLGAAHALANPLTATYGIAHGEAIGIVLPHMILRNGQSEAAPRFEELCRDVDPDEGSFGGDAAQGLAAYITEMVERGGLAGCLSDCGVDHERLPALAADATKQWTGKFNPVELTEADYVKLYEAAF